MGFGAADAVSAERNDRREHFAVEELACLLAKAAVVNIRDIEYPAAAEAKEMIMRVGVSVIPCRAA